MAAIEATVNGQGDAAINSQLFNLSTAAAQWTISIDLDENPQLDISQISDIEIILDTTSHARGGQRKSELEDLVQFEINGAINRSMQYFGPQGDEIESPDGIDPSLAALACCLALHGDLSNCLDPHGDTESPGESRSRSSRNRNTQLRIATTPVVSGAYAGTVAITSPVQMGEVSFALNLTDMNSSLTGELNFERTLLHTGEVTVQGAVNGNLVTISSAPFENSISGRTVQRQFSLTVDVRNDGDVLFGEYSETITGYTLEPLTLAGPISLVRSQRTRLLSDFPRGLTISGTPSTISPNDTASVAARLIDSEGQPVATQTVTFTSDIGSVSPQVVQTDQSGLAVTTFTAGDSAGLASVVATVHRLIVADTSIRIDNGTTVNNSPHLVNSPSPADGATEVPTTQTLTWVGGDPDNDAVTYTVAFGTANPPSLVTTTENTSYGPSLVVETTYYWQISASDGQETSNGPIWSFTTASEAPVNRPPHLANSPSPADGATEVPTTQTLTWVGGDPDNDAVTYTVAFGTTNPPPEATATENTSYLPSLAAETTYYWQINASDGQETIDGPVWSFTTVGESDPSDRHTYLPVLSNQ